MPRGDSSPGRVRRFINQYLIDRNGSAAAIRSGYGPRHARQRASELLKREDVRVAIEEADAIERQRCQSDRERHLREVAKLAYSNIGSYLKGSGRRIRLLNLSELSAMDMAAVKAVTVHKDGSVTVALHDKPKALELYAKLRGWIEDTGERPAVRPRPRVTVPGVKTA